jgi:aspartate carbamoyltransferase
MSHLVSVDQFDAASLHALFRMADRVHLSSATLLQGKVSANLFYEASTRTSSSFYSAMARLGGSVIPINDVTYSSVSKGETLEDTIRTLACYSDVIVLRHSEVGASVRAARASPVPVINAGDGVGEHPTQALLDLYTIMQHVNPSHAVQPARAFKVALMGDLRHGRTVHSLAKLLRHYPGAEVHLVSPPELAMPAAYVQPSDMLHESLDTVIEDVDVLYVTRVQKERMPEGCAPSRHYALTLQDMASARSDMIVMHPLPRVDEIDRRIDADPRAAYFRQMRNGLLVRQAILSCLLSGECTPPWNPPAL